MLQTYTLFCTHAAQIAEHANLTHELQHRTNKSKRTHPLNKIIRKKRDEYLQTRRNNETQTQQTDIEIREIKRQRAIDLAKQDREAIRTEIEHILTENQNTLTTNLWKYIHKNRNYEQEEDKSGLPAIMNDTTGKSLKNEKPSVNVWHETRKNISHKHETATMHSTCLLKKVTLEYNALRKKGSQTFDTEAIKNSHLHTLFTQKELKAAVQRLPSNKAPGEDGIPFEVIKIVYEATAPELLSIINHLWEHEIVPDQWTKAVIRMIHKKGNKHDATNYRAIVLVSTFKKLYETLLRNRLLTHVAETRCLHKNQFAFIKGHHTKEAIFCLTQTIHTRARRDGEPTYAAFIDFKTAFPSTCRPALWKHMYEAGVQGRLWRTLQIMYENLTGRVLHPQIPKKQYYHINIGLLEGSCLSPILYTFLVNSLLIRLQNKFPNIKITTSQETHQTHPHHETWVGALMYADDLVLLARTPAELQEILDETQIWSEENFATINTDKSYVMAFKEWE